MIVSTSAVVLQSRKFGDSSKIVYLYTEEFGKLNLLAKGARQAKSKLSGMLEPLRYINVTFYRKPGRDLHILSSVESLSPMRRINDSLEHLATGLMILESISQTQEGNLPNPVLFGLIIDSLMMLDKLVPNPFNVFTFLQLQLSRELGFELGLPIDDSLFGGRNVLFSQRNGFQVEKNGTNTDNSYRMSIDSYKYIAQVNSLNLSEISSLHTTRQINTDIKDFFVRYFSFHLEKKFNYRAFNLLV
jgi:DNA repair protein RecO (recombination protein O)